MPDDERPTTSAPSPRSASRSPHRTHQDAASRSQRARSSSSSHSSESHSSSGSIAESPSPPPLPSEPLPLDAPDKSGRSNNEDDDDGWQPIWDASAGAYYFYNSFTQATTWENPRVPPAAAIPTAPGTAPPHQTAPPLLSSSATIRNDEPSSSDPTQQTETYNPAIHGSYDPSAPYARRSPSPVSATTAALGILAESGGNENGSAAAAAATAAAAAYAATAAFNRFTGRFQPANITPDNHNDEAKSTRQMTAYFDVDAAANNHEGRSLKAERQGKKLSRKEVKQFREKRKERKEERRRAWLRD
ncbi:MAG: hypothetical protein M1825_001797 [Sarcosagium campestre]|nr:MAG: hypothetical protein M1825_001797 [Sarcosagium campestre]